MPDVCVPDHDLFNALLTLGLCIACVASFLPQHIRIVKKGSSEGLSPWYLFFGSTGSTASFLNILTLQWPIVLCCPVFSLGSCIEATAGIFQLGLIWVLFTTINVLYIIYFPSRLKYTSKLSSSLDSETEAGHVPTERSSLLDKRAEKTEVWKTSLILFGGVLGHFFLSTLITIYLLSTTSSSSSQPDLSPSDSTNLHIDQWATFLGLSASLLNIIQYIPQLRLTYRTKLVGALSMKMMGIQIGGAPVIGWSIASRPGTTYTTYLPFLVSGTMQLCLLTMCVVWTFRQRRLGIDAFGNPIGESGGVGGGKVAVGEGGGFNDDEGGLDDGEEEEEMVDDGMTVGELIGEVDGGRDKKAQKRLNVS